MNVEPVNHTNYAQPYKPDLEWLRKNMHNFAKFEDQAQAVKHSEEAYKHIYGVKQ